MAGLFRGAEVSRRVVTEQMRQGMILTATLPKALVLLSNFFGKRHVHFFGTLVGVDIGHVGIHDIRLQALVYLLDNLRLVADVELHCSLVVVELFSGLQI